MTTTGTIERIIVPVEWKAVEGDNNSLEGYASTFGNVDLQDDVVDRGAFKRTVDAQLGNGKRIPFLADHHAHTHSVLGSIVEGREDKKGLRIKAEFSSAPSAQDTRIKMLEGHIDRLSIGYEPVDWSFEERDGHEVRRLKEVRLWEISAVVFPANPRAVVDLVKSKAQQLLDVAVKHGGFDLEEMKAEFADRDDGVPGEWFDGLEEVKASGAAEDKRVIRSHSTATSTGEWDGPANEARLSNDDGASTYRRMYAWVDPSADPDTKGAYKFPHHEVSADGEVGAANVRACQTGIAVLNGSRGGADIPDDERSGVYAHLARHLRDADVDPPELADLDDEAEQKTEKEPLSAKLARADALLAGEQFDDDEVTLAAIKARNEARLVDRPTPAELLEQFASDARQEGGDAAA